MTGKFAKYQVLLIFIFTAAVLYFLIGMIAGYIYLNFFFRQDLLSQILDRVHLLLVHWGVYVLLLMSMALVGMRWGRKRNRAEVYKGFKFSLFASALLLLAYLVVIGDAFL